MKRQTNPRKRTLGILLVTGLIVTAAGLLAAAPAQAAVRIRASVDVAPVRASIVVGDGPRLCSIPKPIERRTVVVRECGCGHGHRDRVVVKGRHRHRDHHRQVWVPGYWEQTGPRTARWIPGHWERS